MSTNPLWSRSTQLHSLSGRVDAAPHSHLKQRSRRVEARKRQGRSSAQVNPAPHSHLRQRAEGLGRLREFAQYLFALSFHNLRREKAATGLCSGRVSSTLSSQAASRRFGARKGSDGAMLRSTRLHTLISGRAHFSSSVKGTSRGGQE